MVDFDDVCCICLDVKVLIQINKIDENNGFAIYEEILSIAPNLVWSKKFSICQDCKEKVSLTYQFLTICKTSENFRKENLPLSEILHENLNKSCSLVEDLKPVFPENFKCDICSKEFKRSKSLKTHITKLHKKIKKYKPQETKVVEETEELKEELIKFNIEKLEAIEDEPLDNIIALIEPRNKVKIDYTEKEDEYTDVFKDLSDIDSPYNCDENESDDLPEPKKPKQEGKKTGKRGRKTKSIIKLPVTCEFCGKDFNRKQHLLAHIRCIHTFEKPYKCDQCDAKFSLSHSLLVHKRRHNDDRRYVCTYCGKKFLCSTDLVHHNKIHLNKREYKCEPCNKSFNTISVLQIHKKCVHTDPELWKHICSYCNRKFPIKSSLTAHLRRHTGEKNFSCNICGKCFYDKKMVENHYRSHTDERLFKCHLCEKDYKDRGGLNLHLKKVHNVGNATIPPPPPKKFGCHLCPKAFSSRGKLQKHICTHTGEKMFNCHLCDKKFNDSWYKKVHLQRKHNFNPSDETKNANTPAVVPQVINTSSVQTTSIQTNYVQSNHNAQENITQLTTMQPIPLMQEYVIKQDLLTHEQIRMPQQIILQQSNIHMQSGIQSGHSSPY